MKFGDDLVTITSKTEEQRGTGVAEKSQLGLVGVTIRLNPYLLNEHFKF